MLRRFLGGGGVAIGAVADLSFRNLTACEMWRCGCDFPCFLNYTLYAASLVVPGDAITDDHGTLKFCI